MIEDNAPLTRLVSEGRCRQIRADAARGLTNGQMMEKYQIGKHTLNRIIYKRGAYAEPEEGCDG